MTATPMQANEYEIRKMKADLSTLAKNVKELRSKKDLRYPLLIEFCGTPKSGKTTIINALNLFLRRSGFKTIVLTERASVCPISDKTHPFFNLWTLTSAVSDIIKALDKNRSNGKVDFILADRGIFDALCWFEWLERLHNNKTVRPFSDRDYQTVKDFILMDIWKKHLSLIFVFKVKPQIAIDREYANLLTDIAGTIMDKRVLEDFNSCIDDVKSKYAEHFRKAIRQEKLDTLVSYDNNSSDINKTNYDVTRKVLELVKEVLTEYIGYFAYTLVDDLLYGVNDLNVLSKYPLQYGVRSRVEEMNAIQPVCIAVITNKNRDKVLVVQKDISKTSPASPERQRHLTYLGGHVHYEDSLQEGTDLMELSEVFKTTLNRELDEEIHLVPAIEIEPFLIYTPETNSKSNKHLAICYVIEYDFDKHEELKLYSDEFIKNNSSELSGQLLDINKLNIEDIKFDSWSLQILEKVFNLKTPKENTEFVRNID
jgi:predicted NUDIX family phosphoesterase/predicted ATPase